jgi:hypothetical protein
MNSSQYIMRFPNPKEVERAVFFGKRMEMKSCVAVLNLAPWTAAVGSSGMLNRAWVRVKNIPAEKRCDEIAAYVGSLVGVTLEVDQATLHKSEFCRILLGCRDINKIPENAEGTLGDYFYIFSYEVETVVVQGPPVIPSAVNVSNSSMPPSPKRPRTENFSSASRLLRWRPLIMVMGQVVNLVGLVLGDLMGWLWLLSLSMSMSMSRRRVNLVGLVLGGRLG